MGKANYQAAHIAASTSVSSATSINFWYVSVAMSVGSVPVDHSRARKMCTRLTRPSPISIARVLPIDSPRWTPAMARPIHREYNDIKPAVTARELV